MHDRFRYRRDAIMVRAGRRVTFAVTNAGKLPHEFTLGDRATQLDHERQMQLADLAGGHAHHHGAASGTLTVPRARPDTSPGPSTSQSWCLVLYGCHVLGHWAAGMRGTIVVLAPDRPPPLLARSSLPG